MKLDADRPSDPQRHSGSNPRPERPHYCFIPPRSSIFERAGVQSGPGNGHPHRGKTLDPARVHRPEHLLPRFTSRRRGSSCMWATAAHNSLAGFAVDAATGQLTAPRARGDRSGPECLWSRPRWASSSLPPARHRAGWRVSHSLARQGALTPWRRMPWASGRGGCWSHRLGD